jgi:hypothetical protein
MADGMSGAYSGPASGGGLVGGLGEADVNSGTSGMVSSGRRGDGGRREGRVVEWQGLSEEQCRWMVGRRCRIISIHLESQLARAP